MYNFLIDYNERNYLDALIYIFLICFLLDVSFNFFKRVGWGGESWKHHLCFKTILFVLFIKLLNKVKKDKEKTVQ